MLLSSCAARSRASKTWSLRDETGVLEKLEDVFFVGGHLGKERGVTEKRETKCSALKDKDAPPGVNATADDEISRFRCSSFPSLI